MESRLSMLSPGEFKEVDQSGFRLLAEQSMVGVYVFFAEHILYVNQAIAEMFGYQPDELIGKISPLDLIHPEDRALVQEQVEKRESGEAEFSHYTFRGIRKDGLPIYCEAFGKRVPRAGRPIMIGLLLEITERVKHEDESRELLKFQENIIQNVNVWLTVLDIQHRVLVWNQAAEKLSGYSREQVLGNKEVWEKLYPEPKNRKEFLDKTESLAADKKWQEEVTTVIHTKEGKEKIIAWYARNLTEPGGKVIGLILTGLDTTEESLAKMAFLKSEEQYRSLVENMRDVVFRISPQGKWIYISPNVEKIVGYQPKELIGKSIFEFLTPEGSAIVQQRLTERMEGEIELPPYETLVIAKDGRKIPFELLTSGIRTPGGKLIGIQGVAREISERKQAQRALLESEEKYRIFFRTAKDGVFITTRAGEIIDINAAGLELFGHQEGKLPDKINTAEVYLNPAERQEVLQEVEQSGFVKDRQIDLKRQDGKVIHCLLTMVGIRNEKGEIVKYQGSLRDITEKKALEEQLVQAQKMDALGTLAGGVAHDFNNILTAILGNLDLLKINLTPEQPGYDSLKFMEEAGHRARELVKQLMNFSRPGEIQKEVISLNQVIRETLGFLRSLIPTTIEIVENLAHDPCFITAGPAEITQILTNLIINARDAMPTGGKLSLTTEKVLLDEKYCKNYIDAYPGEFCRLSVRDTGSGIPPEVRYRLFEPFFTTKQKGRGSGLGLTMVYTAVKQIGGWIHVYSEQGSGTEFKIYLPQAKEEVITAKPEQKIIRTGSETVLMADDEEMILNLGENILKHFGYNVLTAGDGEEVLAVFKANEKAVDLVILDFTMPKGGGREVLEKIRQLSPQMPVIISSGYSLKDEQASWRERASAFLPKPFSSAEMAELVRQVLDKNKKA